MKKALTLLMLLVLVVSFVSAGSVYLDTGVSFSNGSRSFELSNGSKNSAVSCSFVSLPIEAGYRHALDNNIVISGSVAEYISLSEKFNGTASEDKIFPSSTVIKAEAGYRMDINKEMYAEFLGGFSFGFGLEKDDHSKTSLTTISLVGEAGISYEITDSVFLRAGAKLAFPFATNITTKASSGSTTVEAKVKHSGFMFNITPFIGGAYQF